MAKEKFVITCIDYVNDKLLVYGSVEALCNDEKNPLIISARKFHNIKEEFGYPFIVDGFKIDRQKVWTNTEIKERQAGK